MKVNPLGIQAYQHLARQEKPTAERSDNTIKGAGEEKVVIEPQPSVSKSALAVKVPSGNYTKFLSPEERQALDLLFARFGDRSRFGPALDSGTDTSQTGSSLGRVVDVKV
jgi:hypothetical protein